MSCQLLHNLAGSLSNKILDIMNTVRRALRNSSTVWKLSRYLFNDIPICCYMTCPNCDPVSPMLGPWGSYGSDLLQKGLYKLWIRSLLKKELRRPYVGFTKDAVYSNEMAIFITTPDWYGDMLRRQTAFPNVENIIERGTEMTICELAKGLFNEAEAAAKKQPMEKDRPGGSELFNLLF